MRILESRYRVEDWSRGMTPFEILISTILSQSTTVANERRGFNDLRSRVGAITAQRIAETREAEIATAIWHAGLAKQKAPRIVAVARSLQEGRGDRLERILALPTDRAREELMALPGVGPKTADVVLAMTARHPTFPVDTHIARIARRWDLVRRTDYESIRAALERWTPPERRKAWHLAIIAHGRSLCKARNPRCGECPVRRDCDWYRNKRTRGQGPRAAATGSDKGLRAPRD